MYIAPNLQISVTMAEKFISASPEMAAKFFEGLATHEALQFIAPLKAEYIVMCLEHMSPQRAAPILRRLPAKQASHIVSNFNIKYAAEVLSLVPAHHKAKIEAALPPVFVKELGRALAYPPGSVGTVMKNAFFTFKTDVKTEEIIKKFKTLPRKKVPAQIYISDKQGKFAGIIKMADLLFYAPEIMAGSAMQSDAHTLTPHTKIKDALALMQKNNLQELPVLNAQNVLIAVFDSAQPQQTKKSKKNIFSLFKKKQYE